MRIQLNRIRQLYQLKCLHGVGFRLTMARTVKPARTADTKKVKVKCNMSKASRMKAAVKEYHIQGDKGLHRIARAWNIPKSTLQRRLKGKVMGTDHCTYILFCLYLYFCCVMLLTKVTHLTVIEPPPGTRDQRLTNIEREFATRLPANQQRRLCDCESCIGHALELALQQHPTEQNFTPGIRFLTLPV